ncbi:MAG TPA: adenylate/guanylate cyclase domain-containing protein [Microthrixaceae bacterium]|nr:adenylate/guanylate cyclase domain-containing protein [Microthrixaceae bacterium]
MGDREDLPWMNPDPPDGDRTPVVPTSEPIDSSASSAPDLVSDATRARTTARGVTLLQITANSIGVAAVTLYFRFLYPPHAGAELSGGTINLVAFGSYLGFMVVLALPLNVMFIRRAMKWVREGTKPTERQRKLLFKLPFAETLSAFVSWVGAAILFGVVNNDAQRIGIGIALAGLVTCTLLYLLLQGHFRPVYALALIDADVPADRRDVLPRLLLAWFMGSAIPLAAIGLSPLITPVPMDNARLGWLAGACVVAGGLVMGVAARSVARPLNRIRQALKAIERGDLDVRVPIDDLGELGRLAEGVNDLAAGIREKEALREVFARQVGQEGLADMALDQTINPHGSGTRRTVTVLFVDLTGYTRFSESNPPEEVVALLNRFFRVVVSVVIREGGWINKFEGDAALCLFGAPQDQADHADRALRAAAAMPAELRATADMLGAGIGVATGEVIAGFIGTEERFEYTVIGDVVNLASRLCDESKSSTTSVLASETTIRAAQRRDQWRPAGRLTIRGRRAKAVVYTLREAQPRRARRYGTSRPSRAERSAP